MQAQANQGTVHQLPKVKDARWKPRNLTDENALKVVLPVSGYKIVKDTKLKAFCLRVTHSGSRAWAVRKWVKGKDNIVAISPIDEMTASAARDKAEEIIGQLRGGIDVQAERTQAVKDGMNLAQAIADYIANTKLADRTQADYAGIAARELAPWAEVLIKNITPEVAHQMHQKIEGDARADYSMRLLRAVMLRNSQPNPLKPQGRKFTWRHKTKARKARLEASNGKAVWKAFGKVPNDVAGALFRTQLLTLMRPCEASSLEVGMVNLAAKRIDLPKTKNGQEHRVYITPALEKVLAPHLKDKQPSDLVFPDCADPRKSLEAAMEEMGFAFSRHDIRKVGAGIAVECGVSWNVVKAMLNHSAKTGDVTSIHYAQATESQKRDGWERVAKFCTAK